MIDFIYLCQSLCPHWLYTFCYRANGGGDLLTEGAGIDPHQVTVLEKYKDIRSIIGDYFAGQDEIVPEVSTNWKFVK